MLLVIEAVTLFCLGAKKRVKKTLRFNPFKRFKINFFLYLLAFSHFSMAISDKVIASEIRNETSTTTSLDSIKNTVNKANTQIAEWTFLIYMQARNNLAPFAGRNLNAISSFKTNPKINFLAQWDQPKQKGAWRYKIEKDSVTLENYMDVKDPLDQAAKLVDFVKWGAENFPAKKYCLILWNHGVGPLNPPYGNPVRMLLSQRNESVCLNPEKILFLETEEVDPKPEEAELLCEIGEKRGVLFDEDNRTYMTNDDLSKSLEQITSKEILGKKLDCLGFDACYMCGVEIAVEVGKYAEYMVASQELELARGWNYDKISEKVNGSIPTASQLAKIIVTTYGDLYRGNTNIFTQSAIRLDNVDRVTRDIDQVISSIEAAAKEDKSFIIEAIKMARKNCLQFTAKVYVDLNSFYQSLLDQVSLKLSHGTGVLPSLQQGSRPRRQAYVHMNASMPATTSSSGAFEMLASDLRNAIIGISSVVIENTSSTYLSRAKGMSVYFPVKFIDPSYEFSIFSKKTRWLNFIKAFSMR